MRAHRRAAGSVIACAALAQLGACTHAWGDLEPSGGTGGTATSSSTSSGTGGASSSSTTTSSGTASSSSTSSGTGGASSSSTSSGTGGSASSSSSSGTGGGAPTHCGGTDLLSWDFSADDPDIFGRDPETDVIGGEGVIVLPPTGSSYVWADFGTHRRYDLRGDRVSVKVTEVPNQAAGAWGGILVDYVNGDDLFLDAWHGTLECGFDRGGNESVPSTINYDPAVHVYWQIRESQGTIHCETSTDGASWTEFGAYDLAASLLGEPSAIQVQLYAASPDQVAMPGEMRFDDLNGGGPASGHWCPAQSYTDDFANLAKLPGPAWLRSYGYNGGSFDQTGDQLNFHTTVEQGGAGYNSSVSYDLTGQRIAIQVLSVPANPLVGIYFGEGNNDAFEIYWDISAGGASCHYDDNNSGHDIWQGAPLTLPAWISLRESGGRTYCEVLENGAWKSYGSMLGVVDPTHVDVEIGMYANQGIPAGNYVGSFDGYNLAPVP